LFTTTAFFYTNPSVNNTKMYTSIVALKQRKWNPLYKSFHFVVFW